MKHPQPEEWIPFLCGEASAETAAQLTEHLELCAECSEQINGWQRTFARLDTWQMPALPVRRRKSPPVLKWAAAAAILIGIGFGGGRFVPHASAEIEQLRAQLKDSLSESVAAGLRQEMREQVNTELRLALAAFKESRTNEFQTQFAVVAERAVAASIDASAQETRRQISDLIKVVDRAREQDRRKTLSLVKELRAQHDKDYVGMRKDLETLATMTDDEFKEARLKFVQLASNVSSSDKN